MATAYLRYNSAVQFPYWTTSTAGSDRFLVINTTTKAHRWATAASITGSEAILRSEQGSGVLYYA